jgi:hypothetical protein
MAVFFIRKQYIREMRGTTTSYRRHALCIQISKFRIKTPGGLANTTIRVSTVHWRLTDEVML